jgi:hypothetical protein
VLDELLRHSVYGCAHRIRARRRAAHEVAPHLTTGAEAGAQAGVDVTQCVLEILCQYPMELHVVSRGDSESIIGIARGQVVEHQVLLGGQTSSGDIAAHDQAVLRSRVEWGSAAGRCSLIVVLGHRPSPLSAVTRPTLEC